MAAVNQVEVDGLGIAETGLAGDDDGRVRGGDVGVGGLGEVSEEDVVPKGGAGCGADVLDVEHVVMEVFVEDAGLDLEGGLGGFEAVFETQQCAGSVGCEIKRVGEAEGEGQAGDDGDDADEVKGAMPAARMAVISESAARRERPSRMPTSTAMGMVTVRALGRV